jgi:pyrimidine deaminase RibD-like protein
MDDDKDIVNMRRAVALARLSRKRNPDPRKYPSLGVVVVAPNGRVLATSYKFEPCDQRSPKWDADEHAEVIALDHKLADRDLSRCVLYTTLEPCIDDRKIGSIPCAVRAANRGLQEVVVGMIDPNHQIAGKGWAFLNEHLERVRLFRSDLRRQLYKLNMDFCDFQSTQFLPRPLPSPRSLKPPLLSFTRDLEPDRESISNLESYFTKNGAVTPRIRWPVVQEEVWNRLLQEGTEALSLTRISPSQPAHVRWSYIDDRIHSAWEIRENAKARISQMWRGMGGKGRDCILGEFANALYSYLCICNWRILQTVCVNSNWVDPRLLERLQRLNRMTPNGNGNAYFYKELFGEGWSGPFVCLDIFTIKQKIVDFSVWLPQHLARRAWRQYLSDLSEIVPSGGSDFIIPQIEYSLLTKRSRAVLDYGPMLLKRITDADGWEIPYPGGPHEIPL